MTTPRRFGSNPRSILVSALAVVALVAAVAGAGLLSPRSAEAQRSSSRDRQGFLGVSLQDLDADLRASYGFKGSGVLVSDVTPGSPAEKVGIEEGDILVRLDDRSVSSTAQVTERVRAMSPGTRVGISVFRSGDTRYLGRAEIADLGSLEDRDIRVAPRSPRTPRTPRTPRAPREPDAPHVFRMGPGSAPRVLSLIGGRGRLGVQTHDLDSDLAPYFKAPGGKGVLVLDVVDDTPAAKAGLKGGDVILGVGGKSVEDTAELRRELADRDAGDVDLRILRNGTERTMTARLGDAGTFDFRDLPGGGQWMGRLDDDDDDHDGDREDDDNGREIRRHVFRLRGDGTAPDMNFEWDGHGMMTPEQRKEFEKEMKQLRDELQDLKKELRDLRDER